MQACSQKYLIRKCITLARMPHDKAPPQLYAGGLWVIRSSLEAMADPKRGRKRSSINHKSEGGRQLHSVVKGELTRYLELNSNAVLPLYIVVMLEQGYPEGTVAANLEAFLGAANACDFAQWCALLFVFCKC